MNSFVVVCVAGFGVLLYLAAKDVQGQLREMRENLEKLETLINKHAGRLHTLEDAEKLARSGILFIATKLDEAEHHRELLDPERFEPSAN